MKINKEMKIAEVLREYPQTVDVFLAYGMQCACCPMAEPESLADAAKVHDINIDDLLIDLNEKA